jgi:hypothetical protein
VSENSEQPRGRYVPGSRSLASWSTGVSRRSACANVLEKIGVYVPTRPIISDEELRRTREPCPAWRSAPSTLPMGLDGSVRLSDSAVGLMESHGWDRMIYVTDLPLTTRRPVISQTVNRGRVTMLCLPAFGLSSVHRRGCVRSSAVCCARSRPVRDVLEEVVGRRAILRVVTLRRTPRA